MNLKLEQVDGQFKVSATVSKVEEFTFATLEEAIAKLTELNTPAA